MNNISKIKYLSFWVFIVPLVTINLCLFVVIFMQEYIPHGVGIGPTFPYFDGGTSISRTARNYPTWLIFKPGMIITAILLIRYWNLNKKLMNEINYENKKIINLFYYFGILSAIFLIFHAIFLGIKFDSDLYKLFRKLILLLFIIFEICAQSFLVINLYKCLNKISDFINKKMLNFKALLVTTLVIVTIVCAPIVAQKGNVSFKHALEWDYFLGVIFFYFLTFLMWKKK